MGLPMIQEPYGSYATRGHWAEPYTNEELNEMLEPYGIKRLGECDAAKCGAACCKVICDGDGNAMSTASCTKLDGERCSIQSFKPTCCSQFPVSPEDGVYKYVKSVCSFRFVMLATGEPAPDDFVLRKPFINYKM